MTLSWDMNTATLLAIAAQSIAIVVYIVKTNSMAKDALASANDAHEKIAILQSSNSLHREQVAANYIDRTDLREAEQRLTEAINQLSVRFDQAMAARRLTE